MKILSLEKSMGYFEPNKDVSLKVFLATCPQSHPPTSPHPALPYLKAYLQQTLPNTQVTQKDLDAIYFSYILSPEELAKRFPQEEAARIMQAYKAQRDIRVYQDIPKFIEAHQTLEETLDKISKQHQELHRLDKESLKLRGNTFTYVSEYSANSRQGILDATSPENRQKNLFYQYYREVVVPHIIVNGYDVVGLSIFLTDQLIPTFLLASMIKEASPNIKVVLGGNYISRFEDVLSQDDELNRRLFDSLDAIVLKNGEAPFGQVIEASAATQKEFELDLASVNQVIYKKDGKIVLNLDKEKLPNLHPNDLPRPDFDEIFTGIDGKQQVFWTPSPVIALYTQRGCPYVKNNCEFCAIPTGNNIPNSGLARSAQNVAEDIEYYQKRYGTKYFSFGNETLSRKFMLALAEELEKRRIGAVIDGYTRTDQFSNGNLDIAAIEKIRKYFRFLQIGFESNDKETLESMVKGRRPFNDSALARALFDNGVIPHAFLMTGFPPEKDKYEGGNRDEYVNFYVNSALVTLRWLLQNKQYIGTYKATRLVLPRDSKMVFREGEAIVLNPKYMHEIKLKKPRDLEYNIPYKKKYGSTELDKAFTELFDLIQTPYKTTTHYSIYHQRQFMWDELLRWSSENRETSEAVLPINQERVNRVLQKLWTDAVGQDYIEAQRELSKKAGVSREKKQRLQATIDDIRSRNIIANHFPDSIPTIDDLVRIGSS